jgi:hypothetical protein
MRPVRAAAAAVSGEHSQTESCLVPDRPGEVTGKRAQAVAAHGGGLAHADAAQAPGLVDARPGLDQVGDRPELGEVGQDLPGSGVDIERHPGVGLPARGDGGHDREVTQAWVGRGTDHHLVHVLAGGLGDRQHVAR